MSLCRVCALNMCASVRKHTVGFAHTLMLHNNKLNIYDSSIYAILTSVRDLHVLTAVVHSR